LSLSIPLSMHLLEPVVGLLFAVLVPYGQHPTALSLGSEALHAVQSM
jgi:hypothetical protein